ncbi:MAG: right-handed parallel beta-helix repeat-containing protein [Fulvivirga sp.]|uniref:right-handed parallel beta-helix repeat-containing protein n=1 Tax=Fulvivirga sp. TaxID=1931237 RepID=UPI0032ED268D
MKTKTQTQPLNAQLFKVCCICFMLLFISQIESLGQIGNLKSKAKSLSNSTKQTEVKKEEPKQADTSENKSEAPSNQPSGVVIYVSPAGNNSNAGTDLTAPMKALDKALAKAGPGDRINMAEGVYTGTFGVGYWEIEKPVHIYGGYSADFSKRDPFTHLTVLQPPADAFSKSGNKNVMDMKKPLNGVVVDGLVFEGGLKTPYDNNPDPKKAGRCEGCETGMMLVGPGQKNPEGVMLVLYGNNHIVRNCIFVNSSFGGVRAKIGQAGAGDIEIANNLFVANRMFGVEGFGLKGQKPVEGDIVIHHNTILFSWSRLKDLLDFGYGINVQNDATFKIHHNIIGLNISAGISSQRFNQDLYIDDNLFFGNKKKDLWFNPGSNVNVQIDAGEFGDLDIPSAKGNVNKSVKIGVDQVYFQGFLNAQYNETTDYDPNSQANLMREAFGLNKQGTINSSVSMYANRYPWKSTLDLVGADGTYGIQPVK